MALAFTQKGFTRVAVDRKSAAFYLAVRRARDYCCI